MKCFKCPRKKINDASEPCKEPSNCEKFRLLVWKNFAVQFRHQNRNFFEILVFMILILPFFMVLVPNRELSAHDPFEINSLNYLRWVMSRTEEILNFSLNILQISYFLPKTLRVDLPSKNGNWSIRR